ncbi:MAG: Glycosyl transferase, WecB/TagA/CpsF family [Candidatus Amesbacteria bacterium GW2011_GWA2_47_11b]|uniref:Glycosyl transferase, WecB/TagA/CpsF family n=2 Tax=Candidatus Amesiibacteriota TaxID=1752730 RepID=A0A0G1SDZ3_9BACT|nr:MAG: Glycosyl transferase, WecB/TagA/CpsF family [Candidatus Amesbacteria bacterium GW2011_GWA2_47_11b]KKU67689.1 MAG: Glycosyl transferase, WecB/TagA/CpsF family [Candidatus Amesbacteria bacterium GW2011_GWA1_47_20]
MINRQLKQTDDRVNVLGVGVSSTELAEVLTKIDSFLTKKGKMKLIVTVNPEFVMLAQDDPEFKKILNGADLAIADGVGLKLAGVKNIVPGRRVVAEIVKKYRVFYLGSRVAAEVVEKYGGAYDNGEVNIKNPVRNDEIIAKINRFKPDILLVAYGAPWQEKWLWANRHKLKAKVGMGVGGTFDYLTGHVLLPPEWVNKMGLEWLWRLVHEPWRWRRQLRLLRFVLLLGKDFTLDK